MKPGSTVESKHLEVTLRKNENSERMIKRFMKMVRNDGILKEYSVRQSFEKPSAARRRKKSKAAWNAKFANKNRKND